MVHVYDGTATVMHTIYTILAICLIHGNLFLLLHTVLLVVIGAATRWLRCYCGLNSDRFMIWQFTSLSMHNISQQPRRQYFITINNIRKL